MKTFLKWAGNKSQIKNIIIKHIEPDCRFVEPFAGSCAISLNINAKKYLITDINADLINLFITIIDDKDFIEYAKSFFTPENNNSEKYYELRSLFNTATDIRLKSALFIYLNKHTFNGLCRYNAKGGFNSPFGKYKSSYFPEKEILSFRKKMKHAVFKCQDFRITMKECKKGDVVYCDPPYMPVSKTANFTSYAKGNFTFKDQEDLLKEAVRLKNRGVKVIISNHDNEISKKLYGKADFIEEFSVQRYISCIGEKRERANELLAVYYA